MKQKHYFKVISLAITLFFTSIFSSSGKEITTSDINRMIFSRFSNILEKNKWKTIQKRNQFRAYYFDKEIESFIVNIHFKNNKINIDTNKDGIKDSKSFNFNPRQTDQTAKGMIENSIIPFLMKNIKVVKNSKKVNFDYQWSFGYNRTHNNNDFLPAKSQGGLFLQTRVIYDPAKDLEEENLPLKGLDYSFFDANAVIQKIDGEYEIMENEVVSYILLYGKHSLSTDNNIKSRTIYGLFTGMDYFRPGYGDPVLRWNESIYTEQPHIQYATYRPAMWFFQHSWRGIDTGTDISFTFHTGPGFGINSSITMTDITETEEDNRNDIFKAMNHKKQNFYYSLALPATISFEITRWKNIKFGLRHDFYYFIALEDAKNAREILNRSFATAGFYIFENTCLEANYEYWHVNGKVDDVTKKQHWNRLILDLKFYY